MPKDNPYKYFDPSYQFESNPDRGKDKEYGPRDRSSYEAKGQDSDFGPSPVKVSPSSTHPLEPLQKETLAGCGPDEESQDSVRRRRGYFPTKG
jgi:hypothetical protein